MKSFYRYAALTAAVGACSVAALSVQAQVRGNAARPNQTEVLQQATSLAIGNLAWESVQVSEVQLEGGKVKWLATTRSNKYRCGAEPNGDNSFCDPVPGAAVLPAGPAPVRPAQAARAGAAAEAQAPGLMRNMVSAAGRDRSYMYYVSSKYRPDAFNPVVYALHDKGQTVEQFAEQSGWKQLAEDNGFVVVFPDAGPQGWSTVSGGDDAFLKAVYDHAITHLMVGGGAPGGGRGGAAGGGPGGGERGEGGPRRAQTWLPFHYVTGAGGGATVAQEFVMNHPGVFAAIATVDGAAFPAAFAKGDQAAQNYFQDPRGGKNAQPVAQVLKKDVPIAAWLFTTGAPTQVETRQADYFRRSNAVARNASRETLGGFDTTVQRNATRTAQEVRTTVLADSATYDASVSSAIWNNLFSQVARWTSSPNGDLGAMLTEAQVNQTFDVRTAEIEGLTYKYYVKTPSNYRQGDSLPLVISAHGAFFPAWMYLNQIRMHDVGEKEGFITVYINGQQNRWDFTKPEGSDSKFVQHVIEKLRADYGVDQSRIYMQGFSLGSGLTYMMGTTHPQLFAAVSPNSGIGAMAPEVKAAMAEVRERLNARLPMMIVYGDVDNASSTDARIPADGVLRGAIDEMKQYNNIQTADRVVRYASPNTEPYDVLEPGGRLVRGGVDALYPRGRFQISQYMSSDPKPLNLFNFVWVTDMAHGGDPRQAQMEWDYFKQWRRAPDGSLIHAPR